MKKTDFWTSRFPRKVTLTGPNDTSGVSHHAQKRPITPNASGRALACLEQPLHSYTCSYYCLSPFLCKKDVGIHPVLVCLLVVRYTFHPYYYLVSTSRKAAPFHSKNMMLFFVLTTLLCTRNYKEEQR